MSFAVSIHHWWAFSPSLVIPTCHVVHVGITMYTIHTIHVYHVYMVHDHHWIWRRKCRVCSDFKRDTVHSSYMAEGMYWVVWFAKSLIFTNFRRATMAETTWGMDHQNKSHSGTVMSHAIHGGRFTSLRAALNYKREMCEFCRSSGGTMKQSWAFANAERGGQPNSKFHLIIVLFCRRK